MNSLVPEKVQTYSLPEHWRGQLQVEVVTNKGYKDTYQTILYAASAKKAKQKPVIDGKLGDWNDTAAFALDKPYQVKLIHDWNGIEDLSGKAYAKWDSEYLYFALEVTDNQYQQHSYGSVYNGDSIEIAIDPGRVEGAGSKGINEYVIALLNNGETVKDHWLTPFGLSDEKISQIEIKREGTKMIYEMAIPWNTALDEERQLKPGSQLGFCVVVNDNDKGINRGWIEFGSGINYTKNPNSYGDLFLLD